MIKTENVLKGVRVVGTRIKEVTSHMLGQIMGIVITAVQAVLRIRIGHLLTLTRQLTRPLNK